MDAPRNPEELRRLIGTTSLLALWISRTVGLFGLFMVVVWGYAYAEHRHVNVDGGAFAVSIVAMVLIGLWRADTERARRQALYGLLGGGPLA